MQGNFASAEATKGLSDRPLETFGAPQLLGFAYVGCDRKSFLNFGTFSFDKTRTPQVVSAKRARIRIYLFAIWRSACSIRRLTM